MTDYKAIKGKTILNIASDLDNSEAEGEIWFNTTSSDFKTIVKVAGAWATGNDINTARGLNSGVGTQTAAMIYGGFTHPPGVAYDQAEQYDGTTWSEVNDLLVARYNIAGFGTQTAAMAAGGAPGSTQATEQWNGTSWSEVNNLNTAGVKRAPFGTTTSGINAGNEPASKITEEWDGTSWSEVNDLNSNHASAIGAGTSNTSGLVAGGEAPGDSANCETWNGSSWNQLGNDIDAEGADDLAADVSLSSDGNTVAIGAHMNDGNGSNSGHVRIYNFDGSIWNQIGQDIDGEATGDLSGHSVSLSSNGNIVAIGASENDGNGPNSGHVRVYENINGTWSQIGQDINGQAMHDNSGCSVSLNNNGTIKKVIRNPKNYKSILYNDAGQFYWGKKKAWESKKKIFGKKSLVIKLEKDKAIDVNTTDDWNDLIKIYKKNNL